jgi:hypothetical protein
MRSSTTNLIAMAAIVAAVMMANTASAGGFSFGGGNGGGKGGSFKVSFGGGNHNHNNHAHHNHHHKLYHHKYYHFPVKKCYEPVHVVYDQCYHPYYSYCFVYPGDTWYTIAKRCYGHSHLWKQIATYNNLSLSSSALVPGQQIQLPVVNADGTLGASNAPAPTHFAPEGASLGPQGAQLGPQAQPAAPQSLPTGLGAGSPSPQGAATAPFANPAAAPSAQPTNSMTPATPAANIRTISDEPKRPIVTIGSTLGLDGESLGSEKGIVRLRIGGMAIAVEVLEWNDSSVQVKMPAMDLAEAMKADLEVLRADGSLASKSAIELTPAATRLALGN